ncbi:cytochrome P450 [Neisseriaceae bacterium JH1-16]|nr:cytochrome P450 [Neisseriaceae bacterium JH1-16]
MTPPRDPLQAVGHPDPYPYYQQLLRTPLYRDATLGLWVASSAAAVGMVLEHPACRVRPSQEPVPAALAGTPLGDWFGRLVRMNDGAAHQRLKPALAGVLASPAVTSLADTAARCAARLLADRSVTEAGALDRFIRRLPADSIASLFGVPDTALPAHAEHLAAVAAALAPQASSEVIANGNAAIIALHRLFDEGLTHAAPGSLLAGLLQRLGDRDAVLANAIGCGWQAFDATAGLIGNAWARLAEQPHWQDWLAADSARWPGFLAEVARCDAPIQNTRRFVVADCQVDGQVLQAGDAILLLLAAANRASALNPQPQVFDPTRAAARQFSFSHGLHACPGEPLALAIAAAGLRALLEAGAVPSLPSAYRASPNARLPLFSSSGVPA